VVLLQGVIAAYVGSPKRTTLAAELGLDAPAPSGL
jgi:hypothetical protein